MSLFLIDPYRTPTAKLTSKPYPEILIEGTSWSINAVSARMTTWLPIELAFSATVVSGELRQLLKNYAVPAEALAFAAAIVSGELRQLLKDYTVSAEALSYGATIVSGELRVLLFTYENWDPMFESLAFSCSAVSGTLA